MDIAHVVEVQKKPNHEKVYVSYTWRMRANKKMKL